MPGERISIFDVGDYEAHVARGADLLKQGGLVVLPTETVYGIAGVLNNSKSRARLLALRGEDNRPFTIHLARRNEAERYLGQVSELGQRLMKKLWPGPVGLTFDVPDDRRRQVARELGVEERDLYHEGTITLRCPDHIVATDVIGLVSAPVVLTAAGLGDAYAQRGEQFGPELLEKVDLALDAGPSRHSKPSTLLRVYEDRYEIVRAGVYDERIIERLLRTTILFVCSGNTCRSPMAEALARRIIADRLGVEPDQLEEKGISVISAGSFAMPGSRATPEAAEAVKSLGADLSRHRSRPLSVELIHEADIIFTMGRSHAQAVRSLVPSAGEKVLTLDPQGDIDDPIGGDSALYQKLAGQLQKLIEQRLPEEILK